MKRMKTPVIDMLDAFAEKGAVRMCMPGHKGKGEGFFREIMKRDITELFFSDNLMEPEGVIAESEKLFAELFGAAQAYFSVNGSTAGIWAMVSASERILVERGSHRAVFKAAEYLGKECYVINGRFSEGRYQPPDEDEIIRGASAVGADTVLLTSPDYYGFLHFGETLYQKLKDKGIRLFADSAHGAHFGLSPRLPENCIKYCDACVVSVHKTLSAMTQSAVLMARTEETGRELGKALSDFMTTSPSYPLMASIEYARVRAENSRGEYERLYKDVERIKKRLAGSRIRIPDNDDFTRLVLDASDCGGGYALGAFMEARDIYPEMTDKYRAVLILTPEDGKEALNMLADTAEEYLETPVSMEKTIAREMVYEGKGVTEYRPDVRNKIYIPLKKACGERAAEEIGIMPPCVPLIMKGEIINEEVINLLYDEIKRGNVYGVDGDGQVAVEGAK